MELDLITREERMGGSDRITAEEIICGLVVWAVCLFIGLVSISYFYVS